MHLNPRRVAAASILVLTTSLARIAVVLSFAYTALSTHHLSLTQILVGLALFLTFFVLAPSWE